MAADVRLDGGQPIGRHALFKDLAAQAALQDVIRPPRHGSSILLAVEKLLGQAAALHAIQSGHLIQQNGSLLF
jgi:hypothetical protein